MIYTSLKNAYQVVKAATESIDAQTKVALHKDKESKTSFFTRAQEAELALKTQAQEKRYVEAFKGNQYWSTYVPFCIGQLFVGSTKAPSDQEISKLIEALNKIPNDEICTESLKQHEIDFPIVNSEARRLSWELKHANTFPIVVEELTDPTDYPLSIGINIKTSTADTVDESTKGTTKPIPGGVKILTGREALEKIEYSAQATTYFVNKEAHQKSLAVVRNQYATGRFVVNASAISLLVLGGLGAYYKYPK